MHDGRLEERVRAARAELEAAIDPTPPPFTATGRSIARRTGAVAAVAAAVALVAGVVATAIDAGDRDADVAVIAGPPTVPGAQNEDLLAPGEAERLPQSPLRGRSTMASVWTGHELLIWGGDSSGGQLGDGAAFDPRTRTWRRLPPAPLSPRNAPAAVWTGTEMILWGGHGAGGGARDGAAYDPESDTWRPIRDAPFASAGGPFALWTGDEVITFAGFNSHAAAAYDPEADQWRELPSLPGQPQAPTPAAVWTGTDVVVAVPYGNLDRASLFRLDDDRDGWVQLPDLGGGQVRVAWTGDDLLAVAGTAAALYDSAREAWQPVADLPQAALQAATAVWTGDSLLLWGGGDEAFIIDPIHRNWRSTPAGGLARAEHPAAVWADGVFIAWGGFPDGDSGVMLRPTPPNADPQPGVTLPDAAPLVPDRVAVADSNGDMRGYINRNDPPATWNGRSLPVLPVRDGEGNLVGYFGCRFLERDEVERDDFDASAACPTVATSVSE